MDITVEPPTIEHMIGEVARIESSQRNTNNFLSTNMSTNISVGFGGT